MPERSSDVVMKLVRSGTTALEAGSSLAVDSSDTLMSDFSAGKFFEVDDYSIGLRLMELEAPDAPTPGAAPPMSTPSRGAAPGLNRPTMPSSSSRSQFASWRDGRKTRQQITAIQFPVGVDPFSCTRRIDRLSPILFESCANSLGFASATLVKRMAIGDSGSPQGFFRLDFTDVLVVGFSWDDGDLVKETFKFICRGVRIQHRRQASDGTLGAAASAQWTQSMALRTA